MELLDMDQGLKSVASAGYVFSCQEITSLQASLTVLRSKESYDSIYLWGKLFGTSSDYYVAYGIRDSEFEFPSKTYYVAIESKGAEPIAPDFEFQPLSRLTEEAADRIIQLGLDGMFTGVPATLLEPATDLPVQDESGALPPLTELDRLSQLVQEIDFDTAVVPKGAYALNEAQAVVPNSDFKGLGLAEAKALASYVHFRPPTSVQSLKAQAPNDAQYYGSFLDPLKEDLPKGCWAVRQDLSTSLVTLRSLAWPGYCSYHVPGSKKFGGLYFGYGQKNRDLPFIL